MTATGPSATECANAPLAGTGTMRRDLASAYLATLGRIGSWAVVSAIIYRGLGAPHFAIVALVRATLGLLNYTTAGIAPALVHFMAKGSNSTPVLPASSEEVPASPTLDYESPTSASTSLQALYSNGMALTLASAMLAVSLLFGYAMFFGRIHVVPRGAPLGQIAPFVLLLGLGSICRLTSESPGAVLQVRHHITTDNLILFCGEFSWVALTAIAVFLHRSLVSVGATYMITGVLVLVLRTIFAARHAGTIRPIGHQLSRAVILRLLSFGLLVAGAQLADFLYAPTDYLLINRLVDPLAVATYAPAVQIDGGTVVFVGALALVLLPKAALAHAAGSPRLVRAYYVRGTLASIALLGAIAAAIYLLSPLIFRLWLGNSMPATRAILPLMLIHTVVGGSAAVGRSILLGMGRVRPFTLSVLIAGAANVLVSYSFVRFGHLGLYGIILGTITAVVGRCAVWMPWYVLRSIRQSQALSPA